MSTIIKGFEQFCAWIDDILKWLTIGMFTVMATIVLLGIISRSTNFFEILWSEEVGRYLMIWLGFFGAVMALRRGQHIGVLFLIQKAPAFIQKPVSLAVQALMVYFLVFVVKEGAGLIGVAARTEQMSPMSDIPLSYVYWIIPVTGVLMILQLIVIMINTARETGRATR